MADTRVENPGRYTWLWMALAIVLVAGFIAWLALVSEPTSVTLAESPEEEAEDPSAMNVAIDQFAAAPAQYAGTVVRLPAVRVASQLGPQAFWIDLPTQPFPTPYLVRLDSMLVRSGTSAQVGNVYNVSGLVREMSDSVADAWIASGAIAAGQRAEATYGQTYIEAQRLTAAAATP